MFLMSLERVEYLKITHEYISTNYSEYINTNNLLLHCDRNIIMDLLKIYDRTTFYKKFNHLRLTGSKIRFCNKSTYKDHGTFQQ